MFNILSVFKSLFDNLELLIPALNEIPLPPELQTIRADVEAGLEALKAMGL